MSNILNNNFNNLKLKLYNNQYWDFQIDKRNNYNLYCDNINDIENCLISNIDFSNPLCIINDSCVISNPNFFYKNHHLKPYTLENFGYCGVDNGFVYAPRDRISNEEFVNIVQNSPYEINSKLLKLCKVSGNTKIYEYPISFEKEQIKFNGGFLQGFFETECEKFKIFPSELNNTITFEIQLMSSDLKKESDKTLNDKHPNNKGFFLYLGTRAENKWALLYNNILYRCKDILQEDDFLYDKNYETPQKDLIKNLVYFKTKEESPYIIDGYLTDRNCHYESLKLSFIRDEYFDLEDYKCCSNSNELRCKENSPKGNIVKHGSCFNCGENDYNCGDYLSQEKKYNCCEILNNNQCCNISLDTWLRDYTTINNRKNVNYLKADWLANDAFSDCDTIGDNFLLESQYNKKDLDLTDFIFETKNGIDIEQPLVIIKSNNKFLLFDRTKDGFIIPNWNEDNYGYFLFKKQKYKNNLFLLMNKTCSGNTISNINDIIENEYYDIEYDDIQNAIGFRITDNGEIGYRYLIKNCETNKLDIIEGYSKRNIIKKDEWNNIIVKIKPFDNQMKIFIYVNKNLIFVSRMLPKLHLRKLNDYYEKQEGVPFNISLGGGSQGLCDVLMTNYMVTVDDIFPIEKYFGGSFIGYIKKFNIYNCDIEPKLLK